MIDTKAANAARTLAKHGSFRVAAEIMGASASSFSRYIRQAEEYAGQRLFERRGAGVTLTSAGRTFITLLENLSEATGQFEAGAERLRHSGPDVINIGCGPLAARTIVAPLLAELLKLKPELRAKVNVSSAKEPLEELRAGALDIAICDLTHTPDLSNLEVKMLKKRNASFWGKPDHPLVSKTQLQLRDVLMYPIGTAGMPSYWRKQFTALLGGTAEASRRALQMPQVESDDASMVADISARSNLICGGMAEDFCTYVKTGALVELKIVEAMTWNLCVARQDGAAFSALELIWQKVLKEHGT
ncbi:LysR family transcriptional regulator [Shimia sp. R11_0]|uniref:LysR family transcriptional regulator n=1 Tax=Shimia sp. R11_0 TaxID=2821096 RepID=UPI001ADBDF6D|nr:LysR family transcriptional regulator [Shimia sp. R11_0]MBO9479329.1 LysR family transcriptional regulator [Shimia sp. R11_0]